MNAFAITARVLDRVEQDLRSTYGDGFDELIAARLSYLSDRYRNLHGTGARPVDYSDDVTQWCYAFKYVTAHSDFLYKLLRHARAPIGGALLPAGTVRVACFGGGPGSDLLAILRYLSWAEDREQVTKLRVTIYDKESGWWPWIQHYIDVVDVPVEVHYSFEDFDVADPETFSDSTFNRYDLITASFFVSEIRRISLGTAAKSFWRHVLRRLKPGALIAFNDNADERIYGYFDSIVHSAGNFDVLYSEDSLSTSCGDSYDPIRPRINRLNHHPKKSGHVACRVYRKED